MNSKVPPHDLEMEKSVIGSILMQPNAVEQLSEFLTFTDFYNNQNSIIYQAIQTLFEMNVNIDILNLTDYLRKNNELENVGGAYYLSSLMEFESFDVVYKARVIKQNSICRSIALISHELYQKSHDATIDVFSLVSFAVDSFSKLTDFTQKNEVYSVGNVIKQIIENIGLQEKGLLKETVYKSCLSFLDFYAGAVAVVGAKPGTGKTAFMLSSAKVQGKQGKRVGIMSIEMNEILLTARLIQEETKISGKKMLSYKVDSDVKQRIIETTLFDCPIFINPCHQLNDRNLYATISMMVRKYGCEIIYIDYLQLMESENLRDTELQKNNNIIKACTKASKFFNIPVVVLCQMSRGDITIDNLNEKLRGGGIEQGASQIFGIDYIDAVEQKRMWSEQDLSKRGVFKIINSKDRNESPFGEKFFYFDMPLQVISDVQEMYEIPKPEKKNEFDIF